MTSTQDADRAAATPAHGDGSAPAGNEGETQAFGLLGPVLAGALLLWVLIVAAVGVSV